MAESLSSAAPGWGVVSFLSRGMMEMMQQMMYLCWQRKNKICCCVFHFDSKYKVVLGKCNRKETRTKSQEARTNKFSLKSCFSFLLFKLHTHRIDAVPDAAFVRWSIGEAVA